MLRKWQTERVHQLLSKFKDFRLLARVCAEPVKQQGVQRPMATDFARNLETVYASEMPIDVGDLSLLRRLRPF